MDEVEERCEQFKQHNSQLNQLVGRLTAENMGLKQQLVHICQQTGHPLPPPPPLAMHPYSFGQMGLPMVPAPKVCMLVPTQQGLVLLCGPIGIAYICLFACMQYLQGGFLIQQAQAEGFTTVFFMELGCIFCNA